MEKSALQQARGAYQPKLPIALQGSVKVKEGAPTQSVDNQEEIKALFPNTYGMPLIEFEKTDEVNNGREEAKRRVVRRAAMVGTRDSSFVGEGDIRRTR